MKVCELCTYPARIYCEADGASLCSDCDEKVHSANFLVAKHARILLCHVCQSPTPWKASGMKLGPTVSVCEGCVHNCTGKQGRDAEEGQDVDDETDDDFEGEDDYSDDEEKDEDEVFGEGSDGGDEDEDDGDNQVVPWNSQPPTPPVASSSGSEEAFSCGISSACGGSVVALKRTRETSDLDSDDEIGCTSTKTLRPCQ